MSTYKNYIENSLDVLIDRGVRELAEIEAKIGSDFDKGLAMDYAEVLDFLTNQAKVFAINKESISRPLFDISIRLQS